MLSSKDMKADLKKIQLSLEEIERKMDILKDKKRVLLKTKQKIINIYREDYKSGVKQDKFIQKSIHQDQTTTTLDDNPEKYIFKSGRRLYTDAYKNYIVKLCDIYNLKSIEKHANVLYTNIIRWRIEMQRGQIPIDDSYKPNQTEIEQLKLMDKYTDKQDYDYQMKKQIRQYEQSKMNQEQDENRLSSTNSNDMQEEIQVPQNKRSFGNMYQEEDYSQMNAKHRPYNGKPQQEDNLPSSNESSTEGLKQKNEEYPHLQNGFDVDKALEVNPNFNTSWYSQFESQLIKQIYDTSDPINQRTIMSIAKNLRKKLLIAEQDLKFTKEWFSDLLDRRKIDLTN